MENIVYAYTDGHIGQYILKNGKAFRVKGCAVKDTYKSQKIVDLFEEIFKKR